MDNKDKQALIDGTATIPYKLHILNDDGSIKDTLTEEDIVSTDYEDYRYVDSSSLCIGQFVARKLKGEIKTIDKDLQIEDKEISVEMGVNRNDGSKVYDITIDGKSEQETRSGKNLLKNTNVNSGDNNYWSSYSTFNESTNTLTRSTTATTENFISHRLNGIKSGTQYTLSLEAKSNGYVKNMDLFCYNSSVSGIKNKLRTPLTTDYQKITWTFTTDSTTDYSTNAYIRIDNNGSTTSGTEAILTVRNVMLVEGTDTDFEPYGASPSPDYPSEIKSVEGIRNLFTLGKEDTTATGTNVTFNDSEIIINGTTSNSGNLLQKRDDVNQIGFRLIGTLKAGTYTFSSILKSGNFTVPSGKAFAVYIRKADRTIIYSTESNFNSTKNFTLTEETTLYLQIYCNSANTVFNNCIVDFQIEEGSISHDYVPYGHWLKVKNTGKNLFDINNQYKVGQSFTYNGITITYNENGYITLNGTASANGNINIVPRNYTITLDKDIYLCFEKASGSISVDRGFYCEAINKSGASIWDYVVKESVPIKKVPYSDIVSIRWLRIAIKTGIVFTNYKIRCWVSTENSLDFEPYQEQSMLIDMNKSNLCNITNWQGHQYSYGLLGSVNSNVTINSSSTNSVNFTINANLYLYVLSDTIELKPNTTYTLSYSRSNSQSITSSRYYIYSISDSYSIIKKGTDSGTDNTIIFATQDSGKIAIAFGADNTASGTTCNISNIKIYEGTKGYYELCSIDNTKDELNIDKDGNVSITQNIGEAVLNGSESWVMPNSTTLPNMFQISTNINLSKYGSDGSNAKALSNYFINGNTQNVRTTDGFVLFIQSNVNYIRIVNTNISTVAGFKTWLSTNLVTVKYILDKPQTISLGKYNKIESIDDTENITIQTNIDTTFTKISYNLINWYNFGNFLITKPTDDDVKDTLTFDSMDYTKKFNKSFDSSGISFPCTALQLAKYCCEECGVELATTEFLNYDFEVIDNQYTNEDTFRNVMQDIGKLAYSWIRIGWDNKCYIDFNYGKEVDEYNKINNDNYYDLELQQKTFGPVNRVIIGMSDVEGENVYIEDEESIAEYGVTELQIYDNNLTYTPELRNKVIDSAKVLFGLTYTPMTLNTTGHPWFLGNEKVEVTGMDNTIYYMYPWDRTITYSGHIKSKLDSKGETKTETEYKYKGDVENVLKKTRIIVNKQEGTITSLTQTTTTIQDNLQQNYYDKTQTNRLIQTSGEGITNTFSEAGGNNIFRNTGLWFEDSSTSYYIYPKSDLYPSNQTFTNGQRAYEFWDGLVLKEYYDKAANLTAMSLQNGYLEQKQQVPNGNYTVSFKYKKLIESAATKVIINNVEYDLTELEDTEFRTGEQDSDGNYITQPLEVTDGYIFVRFYTNVNNSTIIYDLMVNAGSVKLAYSQNQNETTTDTVNISKGITITSSNTDTTFKANSDGIRTLNKNNETLSEFTDKGMKNKQIEVTDEATIVQVLWQNVGDQTWLTRL